MPQRIPARIELKPAQRAALDALGNDRSRELTRSSYQNLTGMSRSQAAYDLADLVQAGFLERVGVGRSTRYRLVRETNPRQRQWTNERIRAELMRFCAARKTWPSAREFKRARRTDLYVAASRYGGIGFWAAELGLARGGEGRSSRSPLTPMRRLAWAISGAAAGAAILAVSLGVVRDQPARKVPAAASAVGASTRAEAPARRDHPTRKRTARKAATSAGRAASRRTAAASQTTRAAPAPTVSQPVPVSRPVASREPSRVVLASEQPSPGPAPLAAPAASALPPTPLPTP
jgi:hypothetical protein